MTLMHPGQEVISRAGIAPSGVRVDTGAWSVPVRLSAGPAGEVIPCRSIAEAVAQFGPYDAGSAAGYNALDLFFRAGGGLANVVNVGSSVTDQNLEAAQIEALSLFSPALGTGQLSIPGAVTATAWEAVIAAAAASGRTAVLDAPDVASAATIASLTATVRTATQYEEVAGVFGPWVITPGVTSAGGDRTIAPSAAAAARMNVTDAYAGHAFAAAAGAWGPGQGAGAITYAKGVSQTYDDQAWATLVAAGVNVLLPNPTPAKTVEIFGFRSLSLEAGWKQLNYQRARMQLVAGTSRILRQFVFRPIDGEGRLLAELRGALLAYLGDLYTASVPAMYGATPDDAFDVDTTSVNSAITAGAGELRALVRYKPAPHAERVIEELVSEPLPEAA